MNLLEQLLGVRPDAYAGLDTPEEFRPIFERASQQYKNLNPRLLASIAKAESGYRPHVASGAGAMGLMQLMPDTARGLGVADAYDPEQNVMGGAKHLSRLLDKYKGNVEMALAAYNAGEGNVAKYGGIPPFKETQAYVPKIMGFYGEGMPQQQSPIDDALMSSYIKDRIDLYWGD